MMSRNNVPHFYSILKSWNENISCHINKQEMSQPSAISSFQMWMRAPKARCIWKEWIQGAQKLASSHTENTKFLNLISDLWCADCLLPCGSAGKESTCNVGRPGFNPWVGKIPWRREKLPTHSRLENSMDRTVHEVTKSWTQLSDFHFHFCCRLVYSLTPPPASLEQFSLSYWDPVFWAKCPNIPTK